MAKSLTTDQQNAVEAAHRVEVQFIEVDFDAGVQRYTTAGATIPYAAFDPGTLTMNWVGGVDPASIDAIRETEASEAVGLKIALAGISSSQRSLALSEHIQGRAFTLWTGWMNTSTYALIGTPVLEFAGMLDIMYPEDRQTEAGLLQLLIVEVESKAARMLRANVRRYTDRDQQQRHPGDTICRFTSQNERSVVWPAAAYFAR